MESLLFTVSETAVGIFDTLQLHRSSFPSKTNLVNAAMAKYVSLMLNGQRSAPHSALFIIDTFYRVNVQFCKKASLTSLLTGRVNGRVFRLTSEFPFLISKKYVTFVDVC